MATFSATTVVTIPVAEYDVLTISGLAKLRITVGSKPAYETQNVGTLPYGPYGEAVSIVLTGASDGTYSATPSQIRVPVVMVDLSAAQIASPTAAQLASTDTLYQLNAAPYTIYQSDGSALVALGAGGGGSSTWSSLTDKATANLPSDNTPLANALAGKGNILAPVTLTTATSLTAAAHANRQIIFNGANANLTVQADGTGGTATDDQFQIVTDSSSAGVPTLVLPDATTLVGSKTTIIGAVRYGTNLWRFFSLPSSAAAPASGSSGIGAGYGIALPTPANNTWNLLGLTNFSLSGTAVATVRTPSASGTPAAAEHRVGYVAPASAGAIAGGAMVVNQHWRIPPAGIAPLRLEIVACVTDAIASGCKVVIGFGLAPDISGAEPSALASIVVLGADTTDTQMSVMINDGSGAATKVSLTGSWPANSNLIDQYSLAVKFSPGLVEWRARNKNGSLEQTGSATTNIPASNVQMQGFAVRGAGANNAVTAIDIYRCMSGNATDWDGL